MVSKNKLERIDMEMVKLIDKLVKRGLSRIEATRRIALRAKNNDKKDYCGFFSE